MAMTFHIDIVSAESEIYSGTVIQVFAPAVMGEVGILPRHTPLITHLKPGEVRVITQDKEEQNFYVSGGILEIQPHVVTVLSDTALRAKDLDEAAALQAKEDAEKLIKDQKSDVDLAKAEAELSMAMAQLQAIARLKKKR